MDRWGEIEKLIVARRADRLAGRVKALDEQGRKEVAARLPELLKELRGRFDRWDAWSSPWPCSARPASSRRRTNRWWPAG
ncbi:hypothetical protein [Nonomuraea jabiensis]|uniref:hypothetical protein n=1 Tax=Nonomuraea jabiensis TaxID=882448 RepID=UPI0036C53C53